jgi:hypothetical protein
MNKERKMENISGELTINNLRFVMTCTACPEQYDVFDSSGKQVGYVRLRHGKLRCDYPVCGDEVIYEAEPKGNGGFDSDDERIFHLGKIASCILSRSA